MIFNRGSRDDWNYWASLTGLTSLTWNNMLSVWNKIEKYVAPVDGHNTVRLKQQSWDLHLPASEITGYSIPSIGTSWYRPCEARDA
jgi:hypothetical protein